MLNRYVLAVALALASVLVAAAAAHASGPAQYLATQIERVFKALEDETLKAPDMEPERRAAVRRIVDETFDFREASRRALGRHWGDRTPEEQARFVQLFTDLIDRAYLRRLDQYDGERVMVAGDAVTGEEASVQTTVITKDNSQMGVDYLMLRGGDDRWRVYDIKIGGMSLVSNYRAQFQKIIHGGSYTELVKRLEAKVR